MKRNQTLSTILAPFDVPYQIIDEIAKKSKDIFDVKNSIQQKYTVLSPRDSTKSKFFVYEPNRTEFVVFNLSQPEIYKENKPMEINNREIGGTISSSLYVNMTELGLGPDLVDQFADLYGWVVDFQRLQKGDKFKVIYKEQVVEDQIVGIEDIEAAYFEHMGQGYHAIPFEQNGIISYFDEKGNSLKKHF